MGIFDSYKNIIKKAVENDPKNHVELSDTGDRHASHHRYLNELRRELPGLEYFNKSIQASNGIDAANNAGGFPQLGNHPDFQHLRYSEMHEDHWIITGFIDVKGSTKLFNKFTKATVSLITESIVRASIFAVNDCGGYVHRIQGDGLMVYFGGKSIDKETAVKDALKAFSMISFFVKNDLREFFEDQGVKDIYTRAGLDLGHSNQVSWFYSGIGACGEVTTCSLYTSLVPKMQAKAQSNGIVVGQNLFNNLNQGEFFILKKTPIWEYDDGTFYDQFDFDWAKYLISIGKALQDREGEFYLIDKGIPSPTRDVESLRTIASLNKPYFAG